MKACLGYSPSSSEAESPANGGGCVIRLLFRDAPVVEEVVHGGLQEMRKMNTWNLRS